MRGSEIIVLTLVLVLAFGLVARLALTSVGQVMTDSYAREARYSLIAADD